MKKILILAHDFPPKFSVGAERPYSWFIHLPKFGFEVKVVTITQINISESKKKELKIDKDVFWVEYKDILRDRLSKKSGLFMFFWKKMVSLLTYIFEFEFRIFDNKANFISGARQILRNEKFDFIVASGEPFILFKYASKLSKEFNIPWIADYRDDWVENHSIENYNIFKKSIINFRNRLLERKYLKNVKAFTTVNVHLQSKISNRLPNVESEIIYNGVELSNINFEKISVPNTDEFIITYAGMLYDFDYLKVFNEGFQRFMEKVNYPTNVKIHFYGINKDSNNRAIKDLYNLKYQFPDNVLIFDFLEQNLLIERIQKSSLFLNLIAADPSKGYLGTKIYLYAALRKPILSIPSVKNDETRFFNDRDVHYITYESSKVESYLYNLYQIFLKEGNTMTDITDEEIYDLSREKRAQDLIKFLKRIS